MSAIKNKQSANKCKLFERSEFLHFSATQSIFSELRSNHEHKISNKQLVSNASQP
jgi:hypothetical protein